MHRAVIFDLDGTLSDPAHRLHLIASRRDEWDKFYQESVNDLPRKDVIELARAFRRAGYSIYIFTGRSDIVHKETANWLWNNKVNFDRLVMREQGDNTPAVELKRMWLNTYFNDREAILCAFEDNQKIADMYEEQGVTCFLTQIKKELPMFSRIALEDL